jgi:hypothetical protein
MDYVCVLAMLCMWEDSDEGGKTFLLPLTTWVNGLSPQILHAGM